MVSTSAQGHSTSWRGTSSARMQTTRPASATAKPACQSRTESRTRSAGRPQGAGNVISGNIGDGVYIGAGTLDIVEGNDIGTDANGDLSIGNGKAGVSIARGTSDRVGGTTAGPGNVISGNGGDGIFIGKGSLDVVAGNFIGTNAAGHRGHPQRQNRRVDLQRIEGHDRRYGERRGQRHLGQ